MASSFVATIADAYRSKWHDSVVKFIEAVETSSLNLEGAKIGPEEFKYLLKHLPRSHVNELVLGLNNLKNKMKDLAEVLVKTKIRKLNVFGCKLTNQDLFHLMEVLKDTKLTELCIDYNDLENFDEEEENRFISLLLESNLKIFDFGFAVFDLDSRGLLFQALPNTSITKLNITYYVNNDILISFFSCLHGSSLTDLNLEDVDFDEHLLKTLSQNLGHSKLEKLDLSFNNIDDDAVNILVEGLVQSKIVDLDLSYNEISGSNTLGFRLKDTCITTLDLSWNEMKQHGIFLSPGFLGSSLVTKLCVQKCQLSKKLCQKLMESLRFSKVIKLDISFNNLQLPAIIKFAEILKDTNLKHVNFSNNNFTPDALVILGKCIKGSKLSHIDLSACIKHSNGGILPPVFLDEMKGSSITSVKFSYNELDETEAKMLAEHLGNTT